LAALQDIDADNSPLFFTLNLSQIFGSWFVTEVSIKIVIFYDTPPMFGSLKRFWKKLLFTSSTMETKVAVLRNTVTLFVTLEAVTTQDAVIFKNMGALLFFCIRLIPQQ